LGARFPSGADRENTVTIRNAQLQSAMLLKAWQQDRDHHLEPFPAHPIRRLPQRRQRILDRRTVLRLRSRGASTPLSPTGSCWRSARTACLRCQPVVESQLTRQAIELQTEYAKSAFEMFMADSQKIGALYRDLAMQSYKPFGLLAKMIPTNR